MDAKVQKSLSWVSWGKLVFRRFSLHGIYAAVFPRFLRRYSFWAIIIPLALNGCVPMNNGGQPVVIPKIADPAIQGLMTYFTGLLDREDLLSRHTLDDGVVYLEAILTEAGWGKAINHSDYERVMDNVQTHLDDPDAPYLILTTPEANPYPEDSWEHESYDKQHENTCARDFPGLGISFPDLCK